MESPYPQRRPRAGSAGGRPEVESAAKRRRRHARACVKKRKRRPKRKVPLQPVPPAPTPPGPPAPAEFSLSSPVAVYSGNFGVREAERLLWRAGFGPSPGHAEFLATIGLHRAVAALTRPSGAATLTGAAPTDEDGNPLAPADLWGHDHLWWLDRMVRTDQPLMERMTLVWHDWFATSNDGVGQQQLMLDQNELFRRNALGSFEQLLHDVTQDPAMIVWLNLSENTALESERELRARGDGAVHPRRGPRRVHRAGRAPARPCAHRVRLRLERRARDAQLPLRPHSARPRHEDRVRADGRLDAGSREWRCACTTRCTRPSSSRSCGATSSRPRRRRATVRRSSTLYVSSGYQVRPVLEAILLHPDLHSGPRMVKPPVVLVAGLLRTLQRSIDGEYWIWYSENAGQRLFFPPDVSGWDDSRWLDTSTVRGRFELVSRALPAGCWTGDAVDDYDETETPEQAVAAARAWAHDPNLSGETVGRLTELRRRRAGRRRRLAADAPTAACARTPYAT